MYTVSLIFPNTESGKKHLEDKCADVLAKITLNRLNSEELKVLIERLENQEQ